MRSSDHTELVPYLSWPATFAAARVPLREAEPARSSARVPLRSHMEDRVTPDSRRGKDRRADAFDSALDVLGRSRKRMPTVDQRIDDMERGWPTGHEGGTELHEGEALEYQSSTEANALNPSRDVVGKDKRRRNELLEQLTKIAYELDDIDRKYLGGGDGTKPPDPPGCEVTGRFKTKDGRKLWAPVDRHTDGSAFLVNPTAEFNHGASIGVSQWAYDFGRTVGRWPNRREVEDHLAGKRVKATPVEGRPTGVRIKRGWQRRRGMAAA